jgi:ribosome-binding factor A
LSSRKKDNGGRAAGPTQRQLRVGEELRHALVEILRDNRARDPDLQHVNLTVSEVRVSPDLANATAFVMPLGGEHAAETIAALNRASAFFRTELAHKVRLRHAPRIGFLLDESFNYAARIEGLLRAPEIQRDLAPDKDS